jgi:hypothetical protein
VSDEELYLETTDFKNRNKPCNITINCVRNIDQLDALFFLNHLNVELNPICHFLVLLGDLTFMGPCIVSIFQYTRISTKMQHYTAYLYLETALHVSGGSTNRNM